LTFIIDPVTDLGAGIGHEGTTTSHTILFRHTRVRILLVECSTAARFTGNVFGEEFYVATIQVVKDIIIARRTVLGLTWIFCTQEGGDWVDRKNTSLGRTNGMVLPNVSPVFSFGKCSGIDCVFGSRFASKAHEAQLGADIECAFVVLPRFGCREGHLETGNAHFVVGG